MPSLNFNEMGENIARRVEADQARKRAKDQHITNQQGEPQTMTMHAEAVTGLLKDNDRNEWEIGRHLYEARQLAEDKEACEREGIKGGGSNQRYGFWLEHNVRSLTVSDRLSNVQVRRLKSRWENLHMHRKHLEHWDKRALDKLCQKKVTPEQRAAAVERFKDAERVSLDEAHEALALPAPKSRPKLSKLDEAIRYLANHSEELTKQQATALRDTLNMILGSK